MSYYNRLLKFAISNRSNIVDTPVFFYVHFFSWVVLLFCVSNFFMSIPWVQHIANIAGNKNLVLPVPAFNVINGGSHAGNKLAMQVCFQKTVLVCLSLREREHILKFWCHAYAGVYGSSCWSLLFQGSHEDGCGSLSPSEGRFASYIRLPLPKGII